MTGKRFSFICLLLFLGGAFGKPAKIKMDILSFDQRPYPSAPNRYTPAKLKDVWLQFHEQKLCQKLETRFLFPNEKMVVLVKVEKQKDYQKLLKLLEPLQNSHLIEVHPTIADTRKKPDDIKTAPPSFESNSELIYRFHDYFMPDMSFFSRSRSRTTLIPPSGTFRNPSPFFTWGYVPTVAESQRLFEQRITLFAQDIFKCRDKMLRYAGNLPALAHAAFDSPGTSGLSLRAKAVCGEHAEKLLNYEKKLYRNLSTALPNSLRAGQQTGSSSEAVVTASSAFDLAVSINEQAEDLSDSVYQFVYPKNHTVSVGDLRNPRLAQTMEKIRRDTEAFLNLIR
jgi:hypothetical protein